ncbi:MAG: protein-export chaperone SecB [Saprospiraceae bacterium]|nr:protein-export chaperone SecB [Saprospiraceae bacterium]
MIESPVQKSVFRFTGFFVRESHFFIRGQEPSEVEMEISIQPSGIIYSDLSQFELRLDVQVASKSGMLEAKVSTSAFFDFDEGTDIALVPENQFFTQNAPAIVFPYVRAYISTLTAQSGTGVVILPALNLLELEQLLRDHIEIKGARDNE